MSILGVPPQSEHRWNKTVGSNACARRAPAPSFGDHVQSAATLGAGMRGKHDCVIEPANPIRVRCDRICQLKRPAYDVHGPTLFASSFTQLEPVLESSALLCCFGVNFRLHALHCRIRGMPMVFVLRTPLPIELEPQYGHAGGLPLFISITSRDMEGT